jgi:ATP-binding cassette, subfamily B, bacterial
MATATPSFSAERRAYMEPRAAFARARSFLNYHLVAKWLSVAGAVGSAVLYVALLMLLGLFTDLMVNRGELPAFRNLPEADQHTFKQDWKEPLKNVEPTATQPKARVIANWKKELKDLGIKDEPKDDAVMRALQLRAAIIHLGFEEADSDKLTRFCLTDPARIEDRALQNERWELLWRVQLDGFLQNHVGEHAADHFAKSVADDVKLNGLPAALQHDVANMGILSLVFRTATRFDNIFFSNIARFCAPLYEGGPIVFLTYVLVLAVLTGVLRAACSFVGSYAAGLAVIGAITRLRRAVYHHTYRLGTLAFRALGPSEAVSISTRHLEAVHDGLYAWLTVWIREPLKFILLLIFALCVNFWLALAFLLFAMLVWILGGQVAAGLRRGSRVAQHQAADQLVLIHESLAMMRLVKVYLMELFNQSRIERQLAKYSETQIRRYLSDAIYRPVLVFLGLNAAMILIYLTGIVVVEGSLGMTAASAATLTVALVSLYWPLVKWLDNRRLIRRARDSAAVLFQFLDRSSSVGQAVEAEFLPPMGKQLDFDSVSLNEPGTGRKLLRDVSFTIQAGQRIALVGPDDAQKHALVYLIPRFLDPTSGEIRIDRRNLRWVTFDSLRAGIAVVLQHNLVFNDTVANNIGCGDSSYQLPKIMEAAKIAHAHKFIQSLPKGYDTVIGEMGFSLTTSQKFRIALARAIVRDPALLIVEEPQSTMDEDTKSLLDDTFARILPGRTTIFLPHRLSTIRNCDRVFLLYEGKLEAVGDHKELLATSELYRHLQYLEFNEFAGLVNLQPAAADEPAG